MQIKDARKWIPGNGPMSWLRIPDTEANKMPKSHHCASLFSPGCAPCWPAVQLLRELSRCDIRLGEIIALEQKRLRLAFFPPAPVLPEWQTGGHPQAPSEHRKGTMWRSLVKVNGVVYQLLRIWGNKRA